MSEQPKDIISKRKLVTRYSRPIEFVASNSSISKKQKLATTTISNNNGDQVASFYRSIISSSSSSSSPPIINEQKEKEKKPEPELELEQRTSTAKEETIKCDSCDMIISKSDYKRHIQGTAHMVSSQVSYPAPDILTLNGSNVGFKMLQSQGWQYEEGLGPDSKGRRHPIATVLKQDRLGIGHQDTGKKLVTHKYMEIEKRAIERQRMLAESQKDPGKEIAKQSKAESKRRVAILRYMKE
ncbi:hypothetical protein INT46_004421 [Mucor plumbeus]|uniref:G-patch domain-containing protein n=1 Tax=Mucor plumbeus TaxID=97098 RepID=A0A8H7QPB6_9FUNG|nr:hypothetical protein INT46_004421 [Mucor plumbeus]